MKKLKGSVVVTYDDTIFVVYAFIFSLVTGSLTGWR